MAKEFKDYDKKYAHMQGRLLVHEIDPQYVDKWPYMDEVIIASAAAIRAVVYEDGIYSENWQQFRVSLKGWETGYKLGRLQNRWLGTNAYEQQSLADHERIRISNYINAMKRGGLITIDGRVIR